MIKPQGVAGPSPFICFCQKVIPLAYDESMSYYEAICALMAYLKNQVIPALNNNAEATTELQGKYLELKEYVDTYFENLDVQDEINAKLDTMVESGQLQEIIAEYINANAVWGFDNVEALKNATNLVNGSFVKTYGYYAKDDNGGAFYKVRQVTNQDEEDDIFIIPLHDTNLVAEFIFEDNTISLAQAGCKGDGTTDNYDKIHQIVTKMPEGYTIYVPKGVYVCNGTITLKNNTTVKGDAVEDYDNTNLMSAIKFDGTGFSGQVKCHFSNIAIVGTGNTGNGIENANATIENCSIRGFNNGVYSILVGNIKGCHIYQNVIGIHGAVDSKIVNNFIYDNNSHGIYLYNGCNDNIIDGNKIEWNKNNGIGGYQNGNNVIANNVIDRNSNSGISLNACKKTTIVGNVLRRNCADTAKTGANSNQFRFESCEYMDINSNVTNTGPINDDGSGATVPAYGMYLISSHDLNFIGNDFTGGVTGGINKYNVGERILIIDSANDLVKNSIGQTKTVFVTTGNTGTVTFKVSRPVDYPTTMKLRFSCRRSDFSGFSVLDTELLCYKEWNTTYKARLNNSTINAGLTASCSYNADTDEVTISITATQSNYIKAEELLLA